MHLLVGNPTAQSGRTAGRIDDARALLWAASVHHDFLATLPAGATVAATAAAVASGKYSVVIAMGGDGTFAEVAKGLLRAGGTVPMAMLPTGTANDQGKSFGLESGDADLARNVRVIAEGHTVPLDGGRIHAFDTFDQALGDDWFFDSAGWGFSALVLRMRNEDRRLVAGVPILRELYRDQAVYAGAILRAFALAAVHEQPFEAEVTTAAGTVYYEGVTDLIVKNTRIYAGAWVLDPTASPEDGEMELVPFRGRDEMLARGVMDHQEVPLNAEHFAAVGVELTPALRSSTFDIRLLPRPMAQPVEAQIDGEEWLRAERYRVEVVRHALRLVVPAGLDGSAG